MTLVNLILKIHNMPIRETVQIGEPVLRLSATPVGQADETAIDSEHIQALTTDLIDTMRKEGLVGIAAPQVGESLRIFVTEVREGNKRGAATDPVTVYINPMIIATSFETEVDYEGCGSISHGELFGKVERSKEITIKYTDKNGVSREKTASGLMARVIQHENDHLHGVMFTDLCDPKSLVSREYYLKLINK